MEPSAANVGGKHRPVGSTACSLANCGSWLRSTQSAMEIFAYLGGVEHGYGQRAFGAMRD